jgi:hypothetical protein
MWIIDLAGMLAGVNVPGATCVDVLALLFSRPRERQDMNL